jgi:hypothetical protein
MSSVQSVVASPSRGARFFVSRVSTAEAYTATGAAATPSTAGAIGVVVRDMGKTIRTPADSAVGSLATQFILRKVARVQVPTVTGLTNGMASTFVGFSEGSEDPTNGYYTFYINLLGGNWVSVAV